ncbi:MAG: hypothetical protein WCH43_04275 [Verrucomicrobiota bacterium]
MQQTFFQKVLLTIFAGFVAAGMIYLFNHIVEDANTAVGNSVRNTTTVTH